MENDKYPHEVMNKWHMIYRKNKFTSSIIQRQIRNHFQNKLIKGYILEEKESGRYEARADKEANVIIISKNRLDVEELKDYEKIETLIMMSIRKYLIDEELRVEHLFSTRFIYGDEELYIKHKKQMFKKIRKKPKKYRLEIPITYENLQENIGKANELLDLLILDDITKNIRGDEFYLKVPTNTCEKIEYLHRNKILDITNEEVEEIDRLHVRYILLSRETPSRLFIKSDSIL